MTYGDRPGDIAPAQINHRLDGATDLYERRCEQIFRDRGLPRAEAKTQAEFWAKLKAANPAYVIGPADDPFADRGRPAEITTDPNTGQKIYTSAINPGSSAIYAAAAAELPAGGPPTIMEVSRSRWVGNAQPINRFSLNPGAEYYAAIPGPAPTMFGAGDFPVITGSGVDPTVLRWVAWPLRHYAAFSSSRADVALLIEVSLEGDPETWQTSGLDSEQGRAALEDYWGKIATWVSTPADEDQQLTDADLAAFYPPGSE